MSAAILGERLPRFTPLLPHCRRPSSCPHVQWELQVFDPARDVPGGRVSEPRPLFARALSRLTNLHSARVACRRLLVFFWVQTPAPLHSDSVTGHGRPPPAYDRPGTLSIHPDRLDGNLTGDAIPYWAPFDATDLDEGHGRLLETLFLAASRVERIVSPFPATEVEAVLFFGDSNERGIVDELCIKLGSWPKIISAKNPPATSDLWHADPHVCEIELREQGRKLRLASFMSYGVLIERDSQLWDKKLELDHGPWAIEERIELAREFVDQMAWGKIDLVIFNSSE